MLTIAVILLVLAFASGAPLYAVMLLLTAIGALSIGRGFDQDFSGAISEFIKLGTGDAADVFSTIPLFIFAGYIMAASKTAERLVRFSNALLGWMPGGLGIVTIIACAIYTTFTGASGVTIVALGGLLMPALVKQKYPEKFAMGLITGTGSVGLLFPPALPLFIFGTVLGLQQELTKKWAIQNYLWEWDTQRFIWAGIVPGLVLIGFLSTVVVIIAVVKKLPRQKFEFGELGRSFVAALPELALPFMIIAALANGLGGIAEIASVTVLYLLLLEMAVYQDIKPITLWHITKESMALIGAIFIIVFASSAVTNYLVTDGVPDKLVAWTREHIGSKAGFLLALNVLLLIVGMMMDIFSAILIVLPLIAPIAYQYGVNPYHLGVIFLLNLEIGYLTPPVGLNLFISSFKFRRPVLDVVRAVLPFMGAMIAALLVVTYVPDLTVVPPPKPRGTLDGLVAIVKSSKQAVINVKEVTLPGGKVLKQEECGAIADDFERENCLGVFTDVTACRQKPADEAKTCEDAVLKEYADSTEPIDENSGGFEDDEDAEDAEDTEDTDTPDGDAPAPPDGGAAGSAAGAGSGSAAGAGSGSAAGAGSGSAAGAPSGSGAPPPAP